MHLLICLLQYSVKTCHYRRASRNIKVKYNVVYWLNLINIILIELLNEITFKFDMLFYQQYINVCLLT